MATISYISYYEANVGGILYKLGSVEPVSITAGTGEVDIRRDVVATNTTKTLVDVTAGSITDFDFLMVVSDQDVHLEMITDDDASIGQKEYTVKLLANCPFALSSDISYANYTANFGGGTLDKITTVRVRNLGATSANVTCHTWT